MDLSKDKKDVRKMFFKVKKAMDKQCNKYRMIYVGNTQWANEHTKKIEKVNDIYVLGMESSWKPIIIQELALTDSEGNTKAYRIRQFISHVNVSSETERYETILTIDNKAYKVGIYGQYFCNPLTANHVWEGDEEEVRGLIRVNLFSQNYDDSYSSIKHVCNTKIDFLLRDGLTRNNSPIELITSMAGYRLQSLERKELIEKLKIIKEIKENEIFAKPKDATEYYKVFKDKYRKNKKDYSDYYPTFDKKYIDKLTLDLPKEEYDLGVYGLGSAGTAILDQMCRSNWVKTIYLCDFDKVEEKNLINQWYARGYIGETKTYSCASIISGLNRYNNEKIKAEFQVTTDDLKFQHTDYKNKKFKYVVAGFDSIKVRQEFFEKIESGEIEAEYLIDCRYLDLSSSIYIIDTHNKEQMDFYKANLEADAEAFEKTELMSETEFYEWLDEQDPYVSRCQTVKDMLGIEDNVGCGNYGYQCSDHNCKHLFYEHYLKNKPNIKWENTCIRQNYIDIYKYTGAIMFGAFRKIQEGMDKPFTLIEAQTDVNGLPNYMLVKE